MQLKRVSAQGDESVIEYFDSLGSRGSHATVRSFADQMIALIQHLEQMVDAPPQWVTTSHYWFYLSSVDHWDPWKARVFIYASPNGFEMRYRITEAIIDWEQSFATLQARDVQEAGHVIAWALEAAIPNPQGRFFREER
jgi:hypothetical protein